MALLGAQPPSGVAARAVPMIAYGDEIDMPGDYGEAVRRSHPEAVR